MQEGNQLLKIIGIILVLALVITIVTTNIVSITALTLLKSGTVVSATSSTTSVTTATGETVTTVDGSVETLPAETDASGNVVTTAGTADTTSSGSGTSSTTKKSSGTVTTTSKSSSASTTITDKAKVLANYTTVVNKVKKEMPGYTSNDWQTLSNISVNSILYGTLSLAAKSFLETQDQSEPSTTTKGNYGKWFALQSTDATKAGCVLKNTSAIESASQTTNSDGTTTIKITLKKEANPDSNIDDPSKCTSAHGKMFDTTSIAPVMEEAKNKYGIDNASCTYYGTATLVYNTKTMRCVKLDHVIDIRIFTSESSEAKVIADYHFYDFKW